MVATGRTDPAAAMNETVALEFMVERLPFFKFMLKPTIYRVLRAIGKPDGVTQASTPTTPSRRSGSSSTWSCTACWSLGTST